MQPSRDTLLLKTLNFHSPKSINNIIIQDKLGIILDFHAPKYSEATPLGASLAPR